MLATSVAAQGADVVTVGSVSGALSVDVPIYVRDISKTPLGMDQASGSRIQSFSIRVTYSPSQVTAATFTRGGITTALTPSFESSPITPTSASIIEVFSETTMLVPLTLDAGTPGDQVGTLHLTLSPALPAGTIVPLTLDPVLTELTDQAGRRRRRRRTAAGSSRWSMAR